jgi:hypothetical protein
VVVNDRTLWYLVKLYCGVQLLVSYLGRLQYKVIAFSKIRPQLVTAVNRSGSNLSPTPDANPPVKRGGVLHKQTSGHAFLHGFLYCPTQILKGLCSFGLASPLLCQNKVKGHSNGIPRERCTCLKCTSFISEILQSILAREYNCRNKTSLLTARSKVSELDV